jgi:hypothetical protein
MQKCTHTYIYNYFFFTQTHTARTSVQVSTWFIGMILKQQNLDLLEGLKTFSLLDSPVTVAFPLGATALLRKGLHWCGWAKGCPGWSCGRLVLAGSHWTNQATNQPASQPTYQHTAPANHDAYSSPVDVSMAFWLLVSADPKTTFPFDKWSASIRKA